MLETILQSFSFIPQTASEELIFEYVFSNFTFWLPWEPTKLSVYYRKGMFCRGPLTEHFC